MLVFSLSCSATEDRIQDCEMAGQPLESSLDRGHHRPVRPTLGGLRQSVPFASGAARVQAKDVVCGAGVAERALRTRRGARPQSGAGKRSRLRLLVEQHGKLQHHGTLKCRPFRRFLPADLVRASEHYRHITHRGLLAQAVGFGGGAGARACADSAPGISDLAGTAVYTAPPMLRLLRMTRNRRSLVGRVGRLFQAALAGERSLVFVIQMVECIIHGVLLLGGGVHFVVADFVIHVGATRHPIRSFGARQHLVREVEIQVLLGRAGAVLFLRIVALAGATPCHRPHVRLRGSIHPDVLLVAEPLAGADDFLGPLLLLFFLVRLGESLVLEVHVLETHFLQLFGHHDVLGLQVFAFNLGQFVVVENVVGIHDAFDLLSVLRLEDLVFGRHLGLFPGLGDLVGQLGRELVPNDVDQVLHILVAVGIVVQLAVRAVEAGLEVLVEVRVVRLKRPDALEDFDVRHASVADLVRPGALGARLLGQLLEGGPQLGLVELRARVDLAHVFGVDADHELAQDLQEERLVARRVVEFAWDPEANLVAEGYDLFLVEVGQPLFHELELLLLLGRTQVDVVSLLSVANCRLCISCSRIH